MKTPTLITSTVTFLIVLANTNPSAGAMLPAVDGRGTNVVTLNTPRIFPSIASKAAWQQRAREIRTQVLVSAGLWPMPERGPVKARIFGRTEHGDFSVEKVLIETHPGFFLGGNLYRPLGKGNGPFPGVLNPHGHWKTGRFEDATNGSVVARGIGQARLGMVAFLYDMTGYNDTLFAADQAQTDGKGHRLFGKQPADLLWTRNLMGLQTWNSIRALDFMCALPEVDTNRLACTGASGGGTQTFILGSVDDRLAVLAPTVMVSHSMQGGCLCENMPGLRIEYSNMEIAAVPAPRPQIFMAATGDWTKATMTVEGPAVQSIYKLFNAEPRLKYQVLAYNHNYNRDTREHVYAFLAEHLLKQAATESLAEAPYPPAASLDLRVLPEGKAPAGTVTMEEFAQYLKQQAQAQFAALLPKDAAGLTHYRQLMSPAWKHTLQIDLPGENLRMEVLDKNKIGSLSVTRLAVGREGRGDRVPISLFVPANEKYDLTAVVAHPKGIAALVNNRGEPAGIVRSLLDKGHSVVVPELFQTGAALDAAKAAKRTNQVDLFFATYNRTDTQERVQDLVTACAFARLQGGKDARVALCGLERAGLWVMLAAPAADGLVADANQLDEADDTALLATDLFVPGLRRLGGLEGILLLTAQNPIMLHNAHKNFMPDKMQRVFEAAGAKRGLRVSTRPQSEGELANWVSNLRKH